MLVQRATTTPARSQVGDYLSSALLQSDLHSPTGFYLYIKLLFYYQIFNAYFYTSNA